MPDISTTTSSAIVAADYYQPSEIIRMFNDFLAKNGTGGKLVRLRGLYFANTQSQPWNGLVYDRLQDAVNGDDLPIRLPVALRETLKQGSMVDVMGVVERRVTKNSSIQLSLSVSRIETVEEHVVNDRERRESELWQQKSTRTKNVDAIIETLLHQGRRPRIAILLPTASIAMKDFDAAKGNAAAKMDFDEHRISFANAKELLARIMLLDKSAYTAIAIIRGGGTTDATDDLEVLSAVAIMQTPLICAIGHEADEQFIKRLADKRMITPTDLGIYFRDMVERVDKAISQSEAAMRDKITKEYEKRIADAAKQNTELNKRLADASKQQEEINKRLAEANKQVAEMTKLQTEATKHAQEMAKQQAEMNKRIEQLTASQGTAEKRLSETKVLLEEAQEQSRRTTHRAVISVIIILILAFLAVILK